MSYDDETFQCSTCGAEMYEEDGNGEDCDDCLDETECDICSAELLSVYEEMRGMCDGCIQDMDGV